MQLSSKVRMQRLFNQGKCLDVAIDHGIANEPDFLVGPEDIEQVIIKADPTDRVQDFHRIVEAARCPTLVHGGGKGELSAVLEKSAALMAQGASGMVYGRNVYQHSNPSRVVSALMAIVHQGASGEQALEIYRQG